MTKDEIVKELDELGKTLYSKFGTDSYIERCTIHDLKDKFKALTIPDVVGQSEQCSGCEESTGETKLWCCNHCGKRIEDF